MKIVEKIRARKRIRKERNELVKKIQANTHVIYGARNEILDNLDKLSKIDSSAYTEWHDVIMTFFELLGE